MANNTTQWVLITGASTGIGYACAIYLAKNGFGVYAGARKPKDLETLGHIQNVVPIKLDVTSVADIDAAFEFIEQKETGLFGLVNNAGIPKGGPTLDITDEELQTIFNINLLGVHRVTRKFSPLLLKSHGRIIMMSSYNGKIGIPFMAPYVMSKFGLEGYSDCLRRELQLYDVQVIIIEPGAIVTPIWDKGDQVIDDYKKKNPLIKELADIAIDAVTESIEANRKNGLPPDAVAKIVFDSLTVAKPKPRYPVMDNPFMFKLAYKLISDEKIDKNALSVLEKYREKLKNRT